MSKALGLLLALTVFLGGCKAFDSEFEEKNDSRLNVLFVLVDTLRADHLGLYGYEKNTSPFLDSLEDEIVFFQNSHSQATCTYPSVNSILTSLYPSRFLNQPEGRLGIPEEIPSMPTILKDYGYQTKAIVSSSTVRVTPNVRNHHGGFGNGWDSFYEDCYHKGASCITDQAIDYLSETKSPFLLYLHYFDPHAPYRPPRNLRQEFGSTASTKPWVIKGNPKPMAQAIYRGGDTLFDSQDLEDLVKLYDAEIRFFDQQFERLYQYLAEAGLLDETIIVFLSDHGEGFLEHDHFLHCRTVYEGESRTPLFFRVPNTEPKTITTSVSNIDVLPTLLDFLSIPKTSYTFEGRSLRRLFTASHQTDLPVFTSQSHQRSLTRGAFKLVQDLDDQSWALYNLEKDPEENIDLYFIQEETAKEMTQTLNNWVSTIHGSRVDSLKSTKDSQELLKALGYLE